MLPAVNFHLWKFCNYKCRFCFAGFDDVPGQLRCEPALRIIEDLARYGCDKLTFVGGEPTLCPFLGDLVERAATRGITTCVVSNGERLRPLIEQHAAALHWIGLSVDSCDEATSQRLGRGQGNHIDRSIELAELARNHGIRLSTWARRAATLAFVQDARSSRKSLTYQTSPLVSCRILCPSTIPRRSRRSFAASE